MRNCLLFALFFGFLFISADASGRERCYSASINEIRETFTQEMQKDFGLYSHGFGGRMFEAVEEIHVEFSTLNRATLEEARAYTVLVKERLLQLINGSDKLKPYLVESPFPPERVEVIINFQNLLDKTQSDGTIARCLSIGSGVYYSCNDAYLSRTVEVLKEPYQEAARIVGALPLDSFVHRATALESAIDDVFYIYSEEMAQRYGLYVWNIGCEKSDKLDGVSVRFTAFYPVSMEQGRVLQVRATERLLELVNNHEVLREHPLSLDQVRMRLNFRNTRYTRYRDCSLESVALEGGELGYYLLPKDELLEVKIGTEPYSEARQLAASTPLNINMKPRKR